MNIHENPGNRFKSLFEKPAGKALAAISGLLQQSDEKPDPVGNAVISLMKAVLWTDGPPSDQEIDEFRRILEKNTAAGKVKSLVNGLKSQEKINIKRIVADLSDISDEEKLRIIRVLIALALSSANKYSVERQKFIADIAGQLNISSEALQTVEKDEISSHKSRSHLLKSGAGIIVALIVIAVFILTATLLKSVLFGLALAYIFLPLERWYERRLTGDGLLSRIFQLPGKFFEPLKKLSAKIRRKSSPVELTEEEIARRAKRSLISKATTLAVSTFVIIFLTVIIFISVASFNYVTGVGKSVTKWVGKHSAEIQAIKQQSSGTVMAKKNAATPVKTEKNITTPPIQAETTPLESKDNVNPAAATEENKKADKISEFFRSMVADLEKFKPKFRNLPAVRWAIDQVSAFINDADTQREVMGMLLKKSGGIFTFTASFLSWIVTILLNIMLTVFFFSLFLNKMAGFCSSSKGANPSEYMVRMVFNGKWLPGANEESISEGQKIISEIINKLKTWLKGYSTLVMIDMTLFSTVFYLLGVPYWLPLGLIAGCGVLLPYIGPVASCLLTLLVTLAVGGSDVTMLQLIGIAGIYLLENGINEQFFLYPWVIGESLGLTTLETIIVVLLGAIFAGITGMIFAIPTAAVLKYLVPQIYYCWK